MVVGLPSQAGRPRLLPNIQIAVMNFEWKEREAVPILVHKMAAKNAWGQV